MSFESIQVIQKNNTFLFKKNNVLTKESLKVFQEDEINKSIGDYINVGSTARVYKYEKDKIIKIFHNDTPEKNIKEEIDINFIVQTILNENKNGICAPQIFGQGLFKGKECLVFEYIKGKTLTETFNDILSKEESINSVSDIASNFAELFNSIEKNKVNKKIKKLIPSQIKWYKDNIKNSNGIPKETIKNVLKFINKLPDKDTFCHGDIKADNVIIGEDGGIVAIDWTWACIGSGLLEAVRYLNAIESYIKPLEDGGNLKRAAFLKRFGEEFIEKYVDLSKYKITEKDIARARVIVSASILNYICEDDVELIEDGDREFYKKVFINNYNKI